MRYPLGRIGLWSTPQGEIADCVTRGLLQLYPTVDEVVNKGNADWRSSIRASPSQTSITYGTSVAAKGSSVALTVTPDVSVYRYHFSNATSCEAVDLVLVLLMVGSYPAEVLGRVDAFAVTLLAVGQRRLAGRFAASGRPGARLLMAGVAHHRGAVCGALIADDGLAALECQVTSRVPAGDHLPLVAGVLAVHYVAPRGAPLIRFRGGYRALQQFR